MAADELEIAEGIRDGQLPSPQRFGNLLLIALRITGTGAAYRTGLDEFVWREPALYLTDRFLARCNGLPVIWEHPQKGQLDTAEFRRRIIGTIMLPYVKDDEVWGIAKVLDQDAATLLEEEKLSTSPCVVFAGGSDGRKVDFNGSDLLIEGKPTLLDHLAICELGVWDRRGPPAGVENRAVAQHQSVTASP